MGRGAGNILFRSLGGLVERYTPLAARVRARREPFCFWNIFIFWGMQQSCDGHGGAQHPVWHINEPKKTGARSARVRTRRKNPLVSYIYPLSVILSFSCHIPVCHSCRTLCYSLCFSNQTDQGDETEGLEMEGIEMER